MFSGLMATVHLCRERDRIYLAAIGETPLGESPPPPTRYVRPSRAFPPSAREKPLWQSDAALRTTPSLRYPATPHRNHALLAADGQDGVVAPWSPSSGINEDVDRLIDHRGGRPLRKHNVEVHAAEDLLERVKSETAELAFDQIWAVLHDSLELHVPVPALPSRHEVQHVGALGGLPVLPAGVAGEGDAEGGEEREVGGLVAHPEEAREEVDLAGHGRDGKETGGAHDEEGEYCLVGKSGINVGCL
jgi:hypothetical protein